MTVQLEVNQKEEGLEKLINEFFPEARRLQKKYKGQIELLVGFESEWIRPESLQIIQALQDRHEADIFVGSVHHVHTFPIDFDRSKYEAARAFAGGSDEQLFQDYFDQQFEMLQALKPPVVGHFDLIRLYSEEPNLSLQRFPDVWMRVERNLKFISGYGGLLEINSSALRKGMTQPYPTVDVCRSFLALGGRFCLSDDAHGTEQVGLNYRRAVECAKTAGIAFIHYYTRNADNLLTVQSADVAEVLAGCSGMPQT